jgi:EAL domain-containing protein (putative c-di-GMP-specific phosphodiesterase class I)/ActR/RegA family two-component response regulator
MSKLLIDQPESLRVLIVDDEPMQRLILARCVGMIGWQAETAASVDEAISSFSARLHDVVIVDLCLGEQDGIHLLRHLRERRADATVIFVTGMNNRLRAAVFRIAIDLGLRVAGTLAKPVDPIALHALMLSAPAPARVATKKILDPPSEAKLEQALLDREIFTEYQPKIDLMTGQMIGVEALVRWQVPDSELILPDQFIPMAEKSKLINRLTYRVLEDSIIACSRWRTAYPDCSVAVNISPHVLGDARLLTEIDSLLHQHGLPAGALIVEVTESSIISDLPAATELLTRLSIKGVRISMDDFGTGYSSLQSLMRIPFTELKIDRSFVAVCQADPEAWKIVRATLSLARELGVRVVAEGIETAAVNDMLRSAGCEMGQGWFHGRSMRAKDIMNLIAINNKVPPEEVRENARKLLFTA